MRTPAYVSLESFLAASPDPIFGLRDLAARSVALAAGPAGERA